MHIRTNVAASLNDIQAIKAGLDNVVARKGHGADLAWHLAYDPQFGEPPLERLNRIQGEMGRLAQSARKNKRVPWFHDRGHDCIAALGVWLGKCYQRHICTFIQYLAVELIRD